MPKNLSELKSSPDVGLPEKPHKICVSGKLVAELEAADAELYAAEAELDTARADLRTQRQRAERRRDGEEPRLRSGETSPVDAAEQRVAELEAKAQEAAEKADAIRERMEDHTVVLHLRAKPSGEWRQWVMRFPARDEDADPAGAQRDKRWAGAFCNIDALVNDAGMFVTAYGDEAASDDSWEFVRNNAAPGDLTRLASMLVAMHEQVVDLGKSRVTWRNGRTSDAD